MSANSPKKQLTQKPIHPSCDQLTQIVWSTHPSFWITDQSLQACEMTFMIFFSVAQQTMHLKFLLSYGAH